MPRLTAKELCARIGIKPRELEQWIREGLPHEGRGRKRRFDAAAVAAWLRQTGRAKPAAAEVPSQVVTTRAEAARILGVSLRTLAEWMTAPTFPGTAGSPGRQDGYFPIAEIRAWRAAAIAPTGGTPSDAEMLLARRLKVQIDNDRAQVALEKELKTIADAGEVAQFIQRQIATAKALLGEMPDKVESRIPAKLDAKTRQVIRKAIEEVLAETLNALAELAAGDTDEKEDVPDEPGE